MVIFSIVRFISIVSNQVEDLALTDIDVAARGKIAVENCPALRVVYFMSLYMIGLSVKQLFCSSLKAIAWGDLQTYLPCGLRVFLSCHG